MACKSVVNDYYHRLCNFLFTAFIVRGHDLASLCYRIVTAYVKEINK